MWKRIRILTLLAFWAVAANAQTIRDSISLTLSQAESLFLKNNLQLLAQKYSIDSAEAGIITARLYDNPEFSFGSGFYNASTAKFFDYSYDSKEIALQLNQLIKTAGKRNKAISVANTGAVITKYQFSDLIRTLSYTLRNDYFNICYMLKTEQAYQIEIDALTNTANAYQSQAAKGNIAPKDLLRIQSQLYTLQAELASLQNTIDDVESELKLLLRVKATACIIPTLPVTQDTKKITDIAYQELVDSAYRNRNDLNVSKATLKLSEQNLALQRAMAVPDITLSAGYDRLGSYVKDYNSIGISLPIPLFNRNQGNIKQAKIGVSLSKTQLDIQQDQIESQVANAYIGAVRAEKLVQSIDPFFEKNFSRLIAEVTKNFEKHNLSILEFIDFYDAYKQNILQMNTLRYNHMSQLEQLNYYTGTRIFNK